MASLSLSSVQFSSTPSRSAVSTSSLSPPPSLNLLRSPISRHSRRLRRRLSFSVIPCRTSHSFATSASQVTLSSLTDSICYLKFGEWYNVFGEWYNVFLFPFGILQIRCSVDEPLKVMISGAPASGKGTQCELIVHKVNKCTSNPYPFLVSLYIFTNSQCLNLAMVLINTYQWFIV